MRIFLIAGAIVVGSTAATAQMTSPIGLQVGTRVRVESTGRPKVVGSIVAVTPDSLRVSDEEGRVRAVGTSNLRSLEVSLGNPVRAGHVAKGALIGGLIVGGLVAATGAGGDNRAQGDAGFAAVILAPVGALIGGGWAALRAREDWQPLPVASLGNVGAPSASAHPTFVPPAKSKGKRIGIGALVGGAAGAAFVQTQRSSSPKFGQYLVSVVPGMLVGGGIGALWP